MGAALLAGWLERGLDPARILVQDPAPPPPAKALLDRHGIAAQATIGALHEPPAVIVVAVKPQVMDEVFPPLAKLAGQEHGRSFHRRRAHHRRLRAAFAGGHRRHPLDAQHAGRHRPRHHRRRRQRARHARPAPSLRRPARPPSARSPGSTTRACSMRSPPSRARGRPMSSTSRSASARPASRPGWRRRWPGSSRAGRWRAPASCCTAPTSAPIPCARTSPRPAAPPSPPCRC